jgi:AAA domain
MLTSLRLRDVGPARKLEVELSDRLNLFTGDNGLGKSFILDIAWWALTGDWAGPAAWPRRDAGAVPQIEFRLSNGTHSPKEPCRGQFDFRLQEWWLKKLAPSHAGLVSPVFGLEQARSKEAESAIEAAEAFMRDDLRKLPKELKTKAQIHRELVRVLAGQDPFWPRWIVHVKAGRP